MQWPQRHANIPTARWNRERASEQASKGKMYRAFAMTQQKY